MISLGGLSAAPGGYQAAQANMQALRQADEQRQALAAYGAALAALAQQQGQPNAFQVPGQAVRPPMAPQQAGPPMAQPQPFTANVNLAPLPGPTNNPNVDALTQALLRRAGNAQPAGGQLPSGIGAEGFGTAGTSVPATTPPPAQQPPMPQVAAGGPAQPAAPAQPQIRLPSTQGIQPGSLTWPSVVNAIKAANPKISPQVLAQAVNQFVPLMDKDNQEKWKAIDEARANQTAAIAAKTAGIPSGYELDPENPGALRPITGGPADTDIQNVKSMVAGWIDGSIPVPPLTSVNSSSKTMVAAKAEAKRQGFDLTAAARDVTALGAYLRNANSTTQIKMRESIGTVEGSLGRLQDLVGQWDAGGFPTLNAAVLETAKQGILGPKANQIATLLEGQVAETRATLASAVMGGNTPTDAAFRLAADQLKANWSRQTLDAAIEQARANLQFRRQAMNDVRPVGMSGGGGEPTAAPAQVAPAAAAPGPAPEGTVIQTPQGLFIKKGTGWAPYS